MKIITHHSCAGIMAALAGILIAGIPAHGNSLYSTMQKGAAHYEQGRYDEALKSFVDAQIESPEDPQVTYNIASTQYQMKNYEAAIKSYQDAAATARDVRLAEQSLYNIGNCLYRQGKLEESLEYYKKALDLDPNDQDAKYNLEFVREEIKKRLNQAKQREQEQQQKKEQQEKDKQEQEQQQAGNQQQQQEQQQAGNNQEADRQQQDQQEQQQAEEGKQDQAPQQKEGAQQEQAAPEEQQAASAREEQAQGAKEKEGQARQMTKEEAENWLRGVKEGKRDYSKGQEERRSRSYRPSKDW
jgi:Ca-activated chloride channel family protein